MECTSLPLAPAGCAVTAASAWRACFVGVPCLSVAPLVLTPIPTARPTATATRMTAATASPPRSLRLAGRVPVTIAGTRVTSSSGAGELVAPTAACFAFRVISRGPGVAGSASLATGSASDGWRKGTSYPTVPSMLRGAVLPPATGVPCPAGTVPPSHRSTSRNRSFTSPAFCGRSSSSTSSMFMTRFSSSRGSTRSGTLRESGSGRVSIFSCKMAAVWRAFTGSSPESTW